jgi:Type I phosphodiesterase / nucleotide pyrophosphatase
VSGSLCDVLPSAAALLQVPGADDRLGLTDRYPAVRRVVVVLVDGMGLHLLSRLAPHAPWLASVLAGSTGTLSELSCTFPSTTPTSLVSLGTGVRPGEHGVLGFTVNVPGSDRVLTHILWGDDPPPRAWQPVPTWFERVAAAGMDARVVLPAAFAGSGLTDAAYRGARFCGVGPREDNTQRLVAEVTGGPGLVFGYTSVLDTAAHLHGIASPEWARAAADVDRLLTRLDSELPDDALLLVTADHGGLDIAADRRFDIGTNPDLATGLRVVAGEPRVRYLHTADGATADVLDTWRAVLGAHADVMTRDEAVADGRFGPVRPAHRDRIGDVVVTCREDVVVLSTHSEPPEVARLIGFHGAWTPAEYAIPLISRAG